MTMDYYTDFTIINNPEPIVMIEWKMFVRLLNKLPQKTIIDEFGADILSMRSWKKLSKKDVIDKIFIEYETSFPK